MISTDGMTPMEIGGDGQYRLPGGDKRLWVKFSKKSRRAGFKSEQAGRPIFEDVDYISIQQPGERDQLVRPVREEDKYRFPQQWEAYLREAEQTPEGTPLALLFPNEPSVVEMMNGLKIYTVEQLAELTEHAIERLGIEGRRYVAKAKATLDQSVKAAEINQLQRQVDDLKAQSETLIAQNAALLKEIAAMREVDDEEPAPKLHWRAAKKLREQAQHEIHEPLPPRERELVNG